MSLKNETHSAFEDTKTVYREYVSGMSRKRLGREFYQDTDRLKQLYEDAIREDTPHVKGQELATHQKLLRLFSALTNRLNPTRRLLFGVSLIAFVFNYLFDFFDITDYVPFYSLLFPFAFASMAVLLLLELLEKSDVKHEIDLAREIQLSLLPASRFQRDTLEIASFANTAKDVGGDYVDIIETPNGIYKIIADVSGKGLAAALYMVRMQALVHLIIEKEEPTPKELFMYLNDYVKSDAKDRTFVTACAAFFPHDAEQMVYARAGHNAPIFFSKERDATFELRSNGFALGMTSTMNLTRHLQEKTFHFKPGDTVFFYTDGLTEARNTLGEEYGMERLDSILSIYGSLHATTVVDKVRHSLENFIEDELPGDDVTFTSVHRPE